MQQSMEVYSKKNLIKTKTRSALKTLTVDHLMRVALIDDIDWYLVLQAFVNKKQGMI